MERVMRLPPGFRFHPTDEELVEQYLKRKVFCCPLPASIIPDVELSRYDPWDLPVVGAGFSDKERYIFNWREAKYRVGSRCNRAAGSGYWKVTGKDRQVMATRSNQVVGMKRVLVFYQGKAPHGSRTDWVMHEYRLMDARAPQAHITPPRKHHFMTLDPTVHKEEDWVLCRVFKKRRAVQDEDEEPEGKEVPMFFDFMRQQDAIPRSPAISESSCVTSECSISDEEIDEGSNCSTLRLLR